MTSRRPTAICFEHTSHVPKVPSSIRARARFTAFNCCGSRPCTVTSANLGANVSVGPELVPPSAFQRGQPFEFDRQSVESGAKVGQIVITEPI